MDSGAGIRLTGRHLEELSHIWRGVREAEGARLESAYGLKPIEGSNPSLSAMRTRNSQNSSFSRDFSCALKWLRTELKGQSSSLICSSNFFDSTPVN